MILPLLVQVSLHGLRLHLGVEVELVIEAEPLMAEHSFGVWPQRRIGDQTLLEEVLGIFADVAPLHRVEKKVKIRKVDLIEKL